MVGMVSALERYASSHPRYREIDVTDWSRGRLRLITPEVRHASEGLSWLKRPEVVRFLGGDFSDLSIEGERRRMRVILDDSDAYHWEIEINGRVVGNINLHDITQSSTDFNRSAATLAYLIGEPEWWGRGVATAAARAVLGWAFLEAGFEVIRARIVPQNLASITVIEHVGFRRYGKEPYTGPDLGEPTYWILYEHDRARYRAALGVGGLRRVLTYLGALSDQHATCANCCRSAMSHSGWRAPGG
jgi:[ribosomal protein S5]-alanine N-acetyltransferase